MATFCKTCGKDVGCSCNLDVNGNCSKCRNKASRMIKRFKNVSI